MNKILLSFLAVFLIVEEWLWDLLTAFGRSLFHWLNLEQFEQWLSQTGPTMALVAFSIPLLPRSISWHSDLLRMDLFCKAS